MISELVVSMKSQLKSKVGEEGKFRDQLVSNLRQLTLYHGVSTAKANRSGSDNLPFLTLYRLVWNNGN